MELRSVRFGYGAWAAVTVRLSQTPGKVSQHQRQDDNHSRERGHQHPDKAHSPGSASLSLANVDTLLRFFR
jgi:hypothetical protein